MASRKPFIGLINIIRFNLPFYLVTFTLFIFMLLPIWPPLITKYLQIIALLGLLQTFVSLIVSTYIYDFSQLYDFQTIPKTILNLSIANIHAGFDETSEILKLKFPNSTFDIFDFYNPQKHTEPSIKKARILYPTLPETQNIETSQIPVHNEKYDYIFLIFSAHEIRNQNERIQFFNEIHRTLKTNGIIYLIENHRDTYNFLAYNIGFLHFISKNDWIKTINQANLQIIDIQKHTPFINIYQIQKA